MKSLVATIMILNAALFLFGAVQHVGLTVGPFHEPRIIPAAIVETICCLSLLGGAAFLFGHSVLGWRIAVIGNFIALAGVLLGIVALAVGAGPRTASNDLYHRIMLVLIGVSLVILFSARSAPNRR
ncbi:MAG: hypothetical protein WCC92_07560 [Candidatus Korobacteraceae bacterium]